MITGKRMIPSLKSILKSTGKTMLGIIKQARHYDDPSLPSFDPSSNASLHEWGYYGNARDLFTPRFRNVWERRLPLTSLGDFVRVTYEYG